MQAITRTWTETRTARIYLPIRTENDLADALSALGSHYLDADTCKFFGSRVLRIWPTPDGAIWTETTNGPRSTSQRWTYCKRLTIATQEQIDAGHPTHDIETLYKDQGEAAPATAKRRATAAAQEAAAPKGVA